MEDGQTAPVLIDLPMDLAVSMNVKSNSFEGYVDQPVVYLSNAGKPGGYCYSAAASRNLEPAVMGSTGKVRQALDRERKRSGVARFDCAQ